MTEVLQVCDASASMHHVSKGQMLLSVSPRTPDGYMRMLLASDFYISVFTLQILDLYAGIYQQLLAVPVCQARENHHQQTTGPSVCVQPLHTHPYCRCMQHADPRTAVPAYAAAGQEE